MEGEAGEKARDEDVVMEEVAVEDEDVAGDADVSGDKQGVQDSPK